MGGFCSLKVYDFTLHDVLWSTSREWELSETWILALSYSFELWVKNETMGFWPCAPKLNFLQCIRAHSKRLRRQNIHKKVGVVLLLFWESNPDVSLWKHLAWANGTETQREPQNMVQGLHISIWPENATMSWRTWLSWRICLLPSLTCSHHNVDLCKQKKMEGWIYEASETESWIR